jgi:hypothetical protein
MLRKFVIVIFVLLSAQACRSNTLQLNVRFDELSGLSKGDRVLFHNNTAGDVETVHFNPDGTYAVRLQIDKGFANAVTEYSRFRLIDDAGRIGSQAVEILLERQGGKPLPDGASVTGISPDQDLAVRLQQEVEAGFQFFKQQIDKFSDDLKNDLKQVPESEEYYRLKKSLSDLADEIGRAEKQARGRLKDKWLPQIEKEIEAFKKRLRDLGREKEAEPLQTELERIRKI